MQLPIITVPHPTLRKKAQPVESITPEIKQFLQNLEETLIHAKDPEGVAIAAPQVNQSLRIFITRLKHTINFYINPEIIDQSDTTSLGKDPNNPDLEGCLSIPHLYGPILRPTQIKIKAINQKGQEFTQVLNHFEARVVLHEYDHLEGILFTDYTLSQNQPLYLEQDGNLTPIPNPQEIIKW